MQKSSFENGRLINIKSKERRRNFSNCYQMGVDILDIRSQYELFEKNCLSPYASFSANSKGRTIEEEKCGVRTDFQRDRDRIIHSKAFRRLSYKTQVFRDAEDDHFRTRLTHTLEVSQIARSISRALLLNEDLTEAIALGHDLGHTPFGHVGEAVLNEICSLGFRHNEQSIRVVSMIEKSGEGLNLTHEVLNGILNHRSRDLPSTLEGKVVRVADKIAYINHDIEDSMTRGILKSEDLPKDCLEALGYTKSQRIDFLIKDVIKNSFHHNDIIMDKSVHTMMYKLRNFLFENIYKDTAVNIQRKKIKHIFSTLYDYFSENEKQLQLYFSDNFGVHDDFVSTLVSKGEPIEKIVCDYIACMTDRNIMTVYSNLFMPSF